MLELQKMNDSNIMDMCRIADATFFYVGQKPSVYYSVEVTKDIACNIERTYLESVEIKVSKYMEDAITRSFMADLYLSYQKITNIGVVMVVIPNNETELTNIFDQVSRDRLEVNVNAEIKLLNSYLKEKYGVIKCGVSRTYTSLSQKPSFEYMQYLISNEVYKSDLTENASLCSDEIRDYDGFHHF